MPEFITLTKKYSVPEKQKIFINPLLIAYIEEKTFNDVVHSEVGLMGGKNFDVDQSPRKVMDLMEEASRIKITLKNSSNGELLDF